VKARGSSTVELFGPRLIRLARQKSLIMREGVPHIERDKARDDEGVRITITSYRNNVADSLI
jgi:hypothetical protein